MDSSFDITLSMADFASRCVNKSHVSDFFTANIAQDKVFKNILSLGSGFCGTEAELLSTAAFSKTENVYVVEPNPVFNAKGLNMMQKIAANKFQLHNFVEEMQSYIHTGEKLDLIWMCHSVYYVLDDLPQLIATMQHWLSKDGIIVILFDDKLESTMKRSADVYLTNTKEETIKALQGNGLNFTVIPYDYEVDYSNSDVKGYRWLELVVNKSLTPQEVTQCMEALEPLTNASKERITITSNVIIANVNNMA